MVSRYVRYILSGLIVASIIGVPILYANFNKSTSRNFRVVREGVLYRSGQLTLAGLQRIVKDYRIKTVISFREARIPGDPHPDQHEEEFCSKEEINFYRLPYKGWVIDEDGHAAVDESLKKFYDVMKDPKNHPVLVHCFAGKHRTGSYCAIYRMEFEGWSNEDAIAEMAENGYENIDDHQDLLGFLQQYQRGRAAKGGPVSTCCPHCQKQGH